MAKPKKPGYRKLSKLYHELEASYRLRDDLLNTIGAENHELRKKLTERVDQTMIESRIKLANAIGQLIHATTDSIKWIVAKEIQ